MHANIGKLMIMNVGFLLLWSSFNTAQNLAAQILTDNGFDKLGFVSLAVLYLVCGLGCFLATPIVNKIGNRLSFVIGGFTYTMYVATFLLPSFRQEATNQDVWYFSRTFIWVVYMAVAVVNGIGASILWVANGNYIAECANDSNKGLFFSLFWCFLMFSGIVGNLMAAYVINGVKESTFYIVMTGLCLLSTFWFLLI
jgi:MFS family permease